LVSGGRGPTQECPAKPAEHHSAIDSIRGVGPLLYPWLLACPMPDAEGTPMVRMLVLILLLAAMAPVLSAEPEITYKNVAVAADHPAASQAGLEVHRAGGN